MATEYEIDAPKLFTHIAQRAIDQLFDLAEAKVKETLARHKNKNKEVFANYMQAQSERCALVRNLVSDNQSARLSDIYVPLRASLSVGHGRKSRYEDKTTEEITNLLREECEPKAGIRRTFAGLLSAQAGAGKSFFMRNLYTKLTASSQAKVPIFLEARELNAISQTDFAGIIKVAFSIAGQELLKEQAAEGLKSGIFLILIDGFDELSRSCERHYAKVLQRANYEFESCPLLISGRPSELMRDAFQLFHQCDLCPLEPRPCGRI